MKLEAVMVTDVGVVRDHNEDSAHIDPEQRFFVVADGMGGHAAGEVASAMAVDTVRSTLEASSAVVEAFVRRPTDTARRAVVQLLQSAVLAAHQAVYQRGAKETDKAGMGTTLDVLLVAGREAFVAHVGDSRTYLIRDGKAAQLTTDHTVAEVLVIEGKLTVEEALVSPYRTVLVNAIGVAADVGVEMAHLQLRAGDRLLLCSDGLHDYFLAEQEIADNLTDGKADQGLRGMVETAKERGGHDNITGVVVTVVDVGIDAVPAEIEHDTTQPVDVLPPPAGWSDDERTENISTRDLENLSPPTMPPPINALAVDDPGTRPTAPIAVVKPPGAGEVGPLDRTDPGIELPEGAGGREAGKGGGKAGKGGKGKLQIKGRGKGKVRGDDPTEPIDSNAVRTALARLTAGEDPTEPLDAAVVREALQRASDPAGQALARAATEPPPVGDEEDGEEAGEEASEASEASEAAGGESAEGQSATSAEGQSATSAEAARDDDDDDDDPTEQVEPEVSATGDTGPVPKVDKVG